MNKTGSDNPPPFSFTDETRKRILTEYVECLCQACSVFRLPIGQVDYSERELRLAVDEAEIDIRALYARRSMRFGVAAGKFAGVLAYRLARFKIVQISDDGWKNPSEHIHMVQELAALFLARRLFVHDRILSENALIELAYQLSRRHANQETLGAFFDVLPARAA